MLKKNSKIPADCFESHVEDVLQNSLAQGSLGAVLGIDFPTGERLVVTAGSANTEQTERVSRTHLFQIGSITKMYTAACVLKLAQKGFFSLTDNVRDYVSGIPGNENIKIYQLLNHTTGLGNASAVIDPIRRAVDYPLDFEQRMFLTKVRGSNHGPGEVYEYNNVGYWIAERLIEVQSGQSIADYKRSTLFEPLALADTFVGGKDSLPTERMARGYHINENAKQPVETTNSYSLSEAGAAGNLVSNVDDVLNWLSHMENESSGLGLSIKEFDKYSVQCDDKFSIAADRYAMGLTKYNFAGLRCWGHGGAMCGYMSIALVEPSTGLRLCILTNKVTRYGPDWLAQQQIGFFNAMLILRMAIESRS